MSAPSTDTAIKVPGFRTVEELARQWRVPESTLLKECRHLLLLPVEAAEAHMQEEPPAKPVRARKGDSRG